MKVAKNNIGTNQAYEARAVVAKYHVMGHFQTGAMLKVPVYKFLTLYTGEGREAIAVEFKRPAPVLPDDDGGTYLNVEALSEGDIVVNPGLVYRRCAFFPNLMAEHMKALQRFKPKVIMVAEKDDAPAFDLGTFDTTSDQVTKQ